MKTLPLLIVPLLLACSPFLGAAESATMAGTPAGKLQLLSSPDQVPEGLAKSDWSSIRAAYEAGRHAFQPVEGGWQARNPGQQWTTKFDHRGFLTQPREGTWQWGLELKSYGFDMEQHAIEGVPAVKAENQRLSYQWDDSVQEWFVNDQRGLEHGFTIEKRPETSPGSQPSTLDFLLATRGTLRPSLTADSQSVFFQDSAGATVLNYTGLKVWDADGKVLLSRFEAAGETDIRLRVEEQGARYPLTIDPIAQQAYLKSGNTGAGDNFGISVSVSGDTVVVGAFNESSSTTGVNSSPNENASSSGAAYVFVRSGTTWNQQAYLKASNTGANDQFGYTVAVSGDTVVVGAPGEASSTMGVNSTPNNSANYSGAAYVFVRSGTTWSQQAYLKASNTGVDDHFGFSVAVSVESVVVGAYNEDSSMMGVNSTPNESSTDSGAAYVFTRSGTTWSQQAYLKASNSGTSDLFGASVAVSGGTVVVGAYGENSSTTGVNSTPNESAGGSGAAYVFTRSGTTWSQQAYLKASNTGASDFFGYSVSVSGDTVVVGAVYEDSSTTGVNSTPNESATNSGATYVFMRSGTTWSQQAYLKASNTGVDDRFGSTVAVSGDTAVIGAYTEDSSTTGVNSIPNESASASGAAYVLVRSGMTWSHQAYLKASNTGASDFFGSAVAVSGDTVVVGAHKEASSTTGVNSTPNESAIYSGAVYIYAGLGPVPTITGISPATGSSAGGTSVTLTGTNFIGASAVSFGSTAAASFIVNSATSITATTPAHAAGSVDVAVTTSNVTGTGSNLFTYTAPDIALEAPTGTPVNNGTDTLAFPSIAPGQSFDLNVIVLNTGSSILTSIAASITGPDAGQFSLVSTPPAALAAGASAAFTVRFAPTYSGSKAATLSLASNDPDENPFTLALTGTTSPLYISSQPAPVSIYEGDSTNLSVTAVGSDPLNYQWYEGLAGDTTNPAGPNSATLATGNLLSTTSFWVRVNNASYSADSVAAVVTVNPKFPVFTSSANLSGQAGVLFSFQVQATLGPLTFSSANLPVWLTLDPGTGWLTGTPPAAGTRDFTITAANEYRATDVSLHLTITPPKPVITSADTANGRVNDAFSYQITATQNPTTYGAANLPSGLSLNASTGLISGTPTAAGTFVVTITATNSGGTGQQALNLVIAPPIPPPVITSPLFASATTNLPFSYQLTASNTPQSFAIQSGPAWLGVNAATGVLTGTPTVPETVTVQVRATNPTGPGDWSLLSIYVAPDPNAPVVTSLAEARGRKNDPFSFQLTASPAATSYAITGSLPSGITLVPASGLLSGTPSVEGTFNVSVTASNASGQSVATPLSIVLGPARQVPVISSATSFTANAGAVFSTTVLATNTPTSFTFENLPAGLVQTGSSGQITGTLSTPGNFTFTVTATNADGTGPAQSMVLRVQYDSNTPNILAYSGGSGGQLSTTSFAAMPNPLDTTAVQDPQIATATTASTTTSYAAMPNPLDFPGQGPVGPIPTGPGGLPLIPIIPPIIIQPPDVTDPNPGVTVPSVPMGPSGYVGVPFFYQVLVDKPASLITANGLPDGLTISAESGMIGGTPTALGSFDVMLQAANASGLGAPRVMTFTINSKPDTPVITGPLQVETYALTPFSYSIQTSSVLPVTSYTVTGLPDGLTADSSNGLISGAATVTGLFAVELKASSAVGAGAEKILYLQVRANSLAPKITSSASVSLQQGFDLSYQITATNPPIQGYQASGLPDGLSLNATTGLITGKPIVSGIYHIYLSASNVYGSSDPLSLEIQVKPSVAVPVMLMPAYLYFDSVNPISLPCMASNLPSNTPWDAGIGIFAESLPSGMTLNSSTGILSGYPDDGATFTIQLYGVNDAGRGPSSAIQFVRNLGTDQPVITGPLQLSATSGTNLSFSMTTDRPASSYIFRWGGSNGSGNKSGANNSFTVLSAELPLPGISLYSLEAYNGAWGDKGGLFLSVAPASGAPMIQTPSIIYCTAGGPVAANLAASGSPTQFEITAVSPAWPSGLVFTAATGAFSGTVSQSGVISFLARGYNATGPGLTKEVTMVFSPPSDAPAIATVGTQTLAIQSITNDDSTITQQTASAPAPLTGKVGAPFDYQFQSTGSVIRYGIMGLPQGLVYNENTGEVSGEPTKPGLSYLVVTPIGATVSGQPVLVGLLIDPADGTPVMTSAATASAVAGSAFTWQFSASETPGGYNLADLPAWLAFDAFTGNLTGTPEGPGETKIQISAFNALGQGASQDFTINTAAAAGTPVVNPPSGNFAGQAGATFNASISASGTVDFYDATALPFGITLNAATGAFSGTPVEPGTYVVDVWGVNAQGIGEPVSVTFEISPITGTPVFGGDRVLRVLEGQPFAQTFATTPAATMFALDGLPAGWAFDPASGLLQATPLQVNFDIVVEAWNDEGSSGPQSFQVRVFGSSAEIWQDEQFGDQANNPAVAAWNADPDHDGLVNLLERAFNLNPTQPGRPILTADTGTSGLPLITTTEGPDDPILSIQYLRRKASANSGLSYTPQFGSSMADSGPNGWTAATGTETVESIDSEWERVTVEENASGHPVRFGRVRVVSGE